MDPKIRTAFLRIEEWPPLAWLAVCRKTDSEVTVVHGPQVETTDEWFCEAVWAGDYEEGGFDATDIVAGSGGRLRDREIVFVSSGSTVDRLVYWQSDKILLVSNSIACLLAVANASARATYPRYWYDFWTIIFGLKRYQTDLPTSMGKLNLLYFDNLSWDGQKLHVVRKPKLIRDFGDFARYHRFLNETMHAVAANLASPARRSPYQTLCTVSSGYDSPCVAVIARAAACAEAICIDTSRDGAPECGAAIAEHLGMRAHIIPRDGWREFAFPQVPFIAADSTAEAVSLQSAVSHLRGRVLFTGNYGGIIWGKNPPDLGESIVRGDTSGLSHCEFRLWHGYIQCAVPFWGARQIKDVNQITLSPDLREWDIPGAYSRPIPRRIVETAGVPRAMFGVTKQATAIIVSEFLTPDAMVDYLAWLKRHRLEWIKQGRLPPIRHDSFDDWLARKLANLKHLPVLWRLARPSQMDWPFLLRAYVFPWAIEHAKKRYQSSAQFRTVQALL